MRVARQQFFCGGHGLFKLAGIQQRQQWIDFHLAGLRLHRGRLFGHVNCRYGVWSYAYSKIKLVVAHL